MPIRMDQNIANSPALTNLEADVDLSKVSQTTGVGHYYANGTSGDDANDGLSEATPKKTLQAVFDLVPYLVKHNVCVHLAGTFALSASAKFSNAGTGAGKIVIDGGSSLTTVADNGGSPWTADISSVSSIGLTTAGWTVDAYAGYLIEVLSGPAAGQTRTIHSNTATTLVPATNFSTPPGTGAQFRIARPTTVISSSASFYSIALSMDGLSDIYMQRLTLSGSNLQLDFRRSGAQHVLAYLVDETTTAAGGLVVSHEDATFLALTHTWIDPETFSTVSATSGPLVGVGQTAGSSSVSLAISSPACSFIAFGAVLRKLRVSNGALIELIGQGARVLLLELAGGPALRSGYGAQIRSPAGYATTTIGASSTAVGISLTGSYLRIGAGVSIGACSSHGIECNHSRLHLDGAVTGTGNGGAAVYAHSGSVVHIKNGAPPTISGTLGHLSTDGTTNATWWSTLDAGTPLAVLAEMTMAKEVP